MALVYRSKYVSLNVILAPCRLRRRRLETDRFCRFYNSHGEPSGQSEGRRAATRDRWDETGVGFQHPIQWGASGVTTFRRRGDSSSLRKELLPSLLRRQVVMALDDPALVVTLTKFRKRLLQLLHGPEGPHPQQLLF